MTIDDLKICRHCGYAFYYTFGEQGSDGWYCQRHKGMAVPNATKKNPEMSKTIEDEIKQ